MKSHADIPNDNPPPWSPPAWIVEKRKAEERTQCPGDVPLGDVLGSFVYKHKGNIYDNPELTKAI